MQIDWIAVDWGTTSLRAWAMRADGTPVETARAASGIGTLTPQQFEPALLALIAPWLTRPLPVICCGMVGARQGWAEAPYCAAPCPPPDATQAIRATVKDPKLQLYILPGVSQTSPADVMRGEETQIAGFIAKNPKFDGVLCLPGTHSKWVHISAAEIVSFRSFLTGELFDLLNTHSTLSDSIGTGWDDAAFSEAVQDAMSSPQYLTTRIFSLRAENLLNGLDPATARARLSGTLIGLELAGSRPFWLGQQLAIIGETPLADHYATALHDLGAPAQKMDSTSATLAGLSAAFAQLQETQV